MNKTETIKRKNQRKIKDARKKQCFDLDLIKREIYQYFQQVNFNKQIMRNTKGQISTIDNYKIEERKPEINTGGV